MTFYKYFIPLAMAFNVLCAPLASHAQQGRQSNPARIAVPEGPVTIYGQKIEPADIRLRASDYTWTQLKKYMPELLPDAASVSKSPEQLCDHMVKLSSLYRNMLDRAENYLVHKLEPHFKDSPADLALSDRLTSPSSEALNELLELLPDQHPRIMMAKDLTLKSLTILMLRDAAVVNCPSYAKEKKYPVVMTYAGTKRQYGEDGYPLPSLQ